MIINKRFIIVTLAHLIFAFTFNGVHAAKSKPLEATPIELGALDHDSLDHDSTDQTVCTNPTALIEKIKTSKGTLDMRDMKLAMPLATIITLLILHKKNSIDTLILSGNRLTGAMPESIGKLTNLVTLDLSKNKLTGPLPNALAQLPFLSVLKISSNKLDLSESERLLYYLKNRLTMSCYQMLDVYLEVDVDEDVEIEKAFSYELYSFERRRRQFGRES